MSLIDTKSSQPQHYSTLAFYSKYTDRSGGPGAGSGVGGSDWTDCYWSRLRWCSEYRKLWRSCCVGLSQETRGGCWTAARIGGVMSPGWLVLCLLNSTRWRSRMIGMFVSLQIMKKYYYLTVISRDNNMQYRKSKTIHFLGILIGRKINYLKIKQGYRNIMDN